MTSILQDEPQEAVPTPHVDGEPQDVIRVLHVEDEPDQRMMVKLFLERNDPTLHVALAASPDEALHILESQVFSCIVSDYVMPGMNGIELARRVRETSMIPFILYTGQGSEEVASAAFAAGVDDYLRKEMDPSHYEVLAKRVRTAVEKSKAEEAERKRTKEISCLYGISRLVMSGLDLEGIIGGVVTLIPPAVQYPGETCARITFEERSFETDNYRKTPHELFVDIKVRDENVGTIEVSYLGERSEGLGSPFLVEERDLINAISERLGRIIERKQAEKAFRESVGKYRSFVENSRDGVEVFIGADLLFANLQAARLHGYDSVEEFTKVGPLECVVPEDRKKLRERALARQRGVEVPPIHEFKVELADGSILYLESSSSLFEYEGRPAVLSFIRDITERIQNERRLKSLHIHALELSRVETLDEVYETTLNMIEKTLGLKTADFLVVEGDRLRQVAMRGALKLDRELTLDGRGVTVRAVRTRRSQLVPDIRKDVDYVGILHPSVEKALSELAVPVKIGEEVVAVINVESPKLDAFTDVDQRLLEVAVEHVASAMSRLRYTEKLRASEEMWKNLLEASMDAVSVVVGLKIVYVNQSYADLLGLGDPSEAIGRKPWIL